MMKWVNARGAIREAHNALVRRLTAEGGVALVNTPAAAAAAERVALGVWLASCGFDELPGGEAADSPAAAKAALDAYGDVYSAIHRHVSDILPAVIVKAFHPPTGAYPTDAEAGLLWFYAGGGEDKDQEDEDLPAGVNRGEKPALVCWFGDGGGVAVDPAAGWKDMAGDCITHSFAFAVPSASALDAIANLGKGLQTPRIALETSSVPYRPAPVSCLSVVLCVSLRDAGGAMARDAFHFEQLALFIVHGHFVFFSLFASLRLGLPVVEMGAGTGYWAALLQQRGVDVVALDRHPPAPITPEAGMRTLAHDSLIYCLC